MKIRSRYILLALAALYSFPSLSQEVKSVGLTKYTEKDGLSSYYITKIIQDKYGFMWIATQEGLNRFDGRTFEVFSGSSAKKHNPGGSYITDIAEDRKRNLLWIIGAYGDIVAMDLRTRIIVKRITMDRDGNPLSGKWIRCLQVQGDTLWIGGLGLLSAYDIMKDKYLNVDIAKKAKVESGEFNVSRLIFDKHNRLWIFSDGYGAIILDKALNPLKVFKNELTNGLPKEKKLRFWDVTFQGENLYLATSWGLRVFRTSDSIHYARPQFESFADRTEILTIASNAATTIFFSTSEGFYSLDTEEEKIISYQDENREDDWLTFTFQAFYDSSIQKIWVGTQAGLACFSIDKGAFNIFSKSRFDNTKLKQVYALLPISETDVYCGDENGVFHTDISTKQITKIDTASSNLLLFKDAISNIFLSNKNGFYIINEKKIQPVFTVFPELKELMKDQLSCGIQYNDSLIFFSSIIQKGLTCWNTKSKSIKVFHDDSLSNRIDGLSIINYLYKSKSDGLIILTEKSVIKFDPITEKASAYQLKNDLSDISIGNFMDMCETDSSYWFGSYGNGLIETDKKFKIKKIVSSREGLSNNCVYRVFPYKKTQIILTTNNGLAVVNTKNYIVKNYFQADGLHGSAFEQLCGYQRETDILAGGANGFTIIEPRLFASNKIPPKLYWKSIKIDTHTTIIDTSNLVLEEMRIPNDVLQTTISFSALSFSNPTRVTYAYKIKEQDGDWINLGNQNFVNLIGLVSGNYTLQINAFNEDDLPSENPIVLNLIYLPKWYQTTGFKLAIVAIGALLIHTLIRYRIMQINKQQQIRKEIANDLHDDIGSTLNTVKIFTHLAKREPGKAEHLNRIEESLTEATLGLRDMIWVLDDSQDTIFELIERIKKFALPVCVAHQIYFTTAIESDKISQPVSKTEKRNLFLIAKETINNSIKYSGCRNIQVNLFQSKRETKMLISDDGIGFQINDANDGNGLRNIRYRAQQMGYTLNLRSSQRGTQVELLKMK